MKKKLLFCILTTQLVTMRGLGYEDLLDRVTQYKKATCLNSHVFFMVDTEGNKYVVKQYKNYKISKILGTTIGELLALEIGNALGISLDKAYLIPAGVDFPSKNTNLPATLHTFAPGIQCHKYIGENYKDLFLYQQDDKGLTQEVIYHMSRHKDLPPIVALDTFVGNNDRGKINLFYNQATDSFTGIDLGAAFIRDLCAIATQNIMSLVSAESDPLSDNELEGLMLYYQTLKKLVALFPPEYMCAKLDEYAQRAGFFNATFFTAKEQRKWKRFCGVCKHNIRTSYPHAQALLVALEQLFEKHRQEISIVSKII